MREAVLKKAPTIQARLQLKSHFHTVLIKASTQEERAKRSEPVTLGDETALGWILHEREVMHAEVNRHRSAIGLPPVTLMDIRRVENLAVGHSDYGLKFSLYCAELAMGE